MQIIAQAAVQGRLDQQDMKDTKVNHAAKIIQIKNYIIEHFNEELEHKKLEGLSGLSRNYIISSFKEAFRMTPMQFLTWVRVNKAKELALHSNLSVSEIANRVGYSDVHTFGKMVKKNTGFSLTQFCSTLFKHDQQL